MCELYLQLSGSPCRVSAFIRVCTVRRARLGIKHSLRGSKTANTWARRWSAHGYRRAPKTGSRRPGQHPTVARTTQSPAERLGRGVLGNRRAASHRRSMMQTLDEVFFRIHKHRHCVLRWRWCFVLRLVTEVACPLDSDAENDDHDCHTDDNDDNEPGRYRR
jgi:hypothetical protein